MTIVPHDQLQPETLDALIEEFVSRDGAVHGHADTPMDRQIASVKHQLTAGTVVIVFDEEAESCHIISRDSLRSPTSDGRIDYLDE